MRTLADYTGLPSPFNFYEATPGFVQAHPRAVNAILAQLRTTGLWVNRHPRETAALLSPKLGIAPPVVETWLRRVPYGVTPITPEVIAAQQQVAALFHQQKLIPRPVSVQGAVWRASFPWPRPTERPDDEAPVKRTGRGRDDARAGLRSWRPPYRTGSRHRPRLARARLA